jgi:hypothetical protein
LGTYDTTSGEAVTQQLIPLTIARGTIGLICYHDCDLIIRSIKEFGNKVCTFWMTSEMGLS